LFLLAVGERRAEIHDFIASPLRIKKPINLKRLDENVKIPRTIFIPLHFCHAPVWGQPQGADTINPEAIFDAEMPIPRQLDPPALLQGHRAFEINEGHPVISEFAQQINLPVESPFLIRDTLFDKQDFLYHQRKPFLETLDIGAAFLIGDDERPVGKSGAQFMHD